MGLNGGAGIPYGPDGSPLPKAEDTAHVSGDYGVVLLAVRKDSGATLVGADGDYSALQVDADGKLVTSAGGASSSAGDVAHDDVDSGNPVKTGGKAHTSEPTAVANGDRVNAYYDENGYQRVKAVNPDGTSILFAAGTTATATIASAASLSGEVDLAGYRNFAIQMPATWTAANLTFQVATASGGTFQDLYDDFGNEVTVTAAASRGIALDGMAGALAAWRYLKIRSGTTGTPVNQAAERSLVVVMK